MPRSLGFGASAHALTGPLSLWPKGGPGHALGEMTLLEAAIGVPLVLEHVPDEEISRLGAHGLCAGRRLTVEQDAPLGGPRVVRVGSRRLSVPRSIAALLVVRPTGTVGR